MLSVALRFTCLDDEALSVSVKVSDALSGFDALRLIVSVTVLWSEALSGFDDFRLTLSVAVVVS